MEPARNHAPLRVVQWTTGKIGMMITALPAVNAIPAVCRAEPGIRTSADLPVITSRGRLGA